MRKIKEFKNFLSFNVFPLIGVGAIATRRRVAKKFLHGEGIEIGALHTPVKLPKKVNVKYLDMISYEAAIKKFPDLDHSKLVRPEYIDNGFELSTIEPLSQQFVIANHVLEHSPNPIQVLLNWLSVLKPGGHIYFSVPIVDMCFDSGRQTTLVEHFFTDYYDVIEGNIADFTQRNLEHFEEWVTFSEPNILRQMGAEIPNLSPNQIKEKAIKLSKNDHIEIHFHTFSYDSLKGFLMKFCLDIDASVKIKVILQNKAELIAVLQKTS